MRTSHPPLHPASFLGKVAAAADPNAAWGAYYTQCYQQPSGAVPAQHPANPAGGAPAPGDQAQSAQTPGGQPDYTKAWEEYYKKMGKAAATGHIPCLCLFYVAYCLRDNIETTV